MTAEVGRHTSDENHPCITGDSTDDLLRHSNSTINETKSTKQNESDVIEYEMVGSKKTRWRIIVGAEFVVFLYAFSKVMLVVTSTQFIRNRIAEEYGHPDSNSSNSSSFSVCTVNQSDPIYLNETEIQKRTSRMTLYLSLASGIPTIIMSLFLGAYSDYFGRRLLFLLPMASTCIQAIIYTLVSYLHGSLTFLFIGHILNGLCGGFVTFLLACFALASDATGGKSRSFHIAFLETIGIGVLGLSELTLGYIIRYLGYTMPFLISASIALINTGIIIGFIKQSGRSVHRDEIRPSFMKLLHNIFQFYLMNRGGIRIVYLLCFTIQALVFLANFSEANIITVFLLGQPVCWDSVHIGQFVATMTIVKAVCSLVFVKVVQYFLTDVQLAAISATSAILQLVFLGLMTSHAFYYIAIVLGFISMSTSALLRSVMSKFTPSGQYGALFASTASLEAFITVVSSVLANAIYEQTVAFYSGTVFMVMAGVTGLAVLLLIVLEVVMRRRQLYHSITEATQ